MFPSNPTDTFPYLIEEQIGAGSMGVVYRALDVTLQRKVAIKTLRPAILEAAAPELQAEVRGRFLQEARAAAQLSHPGVTVVHRVDEEGATPYIVMEWLDGKTLEQVMVERDRLPTEEAVRLTVELLGALQAAHRVGVVHRDVKPANLVVLGDGRLKVTDFGIALQEGGDLVKTQAGVVLATPQYASPEQLRGSAVDARSDLFSTGVVLYHLLCGCFPFTGDSFLALANAVLQKTPAFLGERLTTVPPGLDAVIQKALSKDPKNRYQSAAEMADALRVFLTGALDGGTAGSTSVQAAASADSLSATSHLYQSFRDLPRDPGLGIVQLAQGWPAQELGRQAITELIERLLEKPLHAPAFAGAVEIQHLCLFLEDGVLLGAVETSGASGDEVFERLPGKATARLHALPEFYPSGFVALLTSVLRPPKRSQSDLDSSFINLTALAEKLRVDRFEGLLRLHRGEDTAILLYSHGNLVASLFSEGWQDVPVENSWTLWVTDFPIRAHVEEKSVAPLKSWYRYALRDFELTVQFIFHDNTTMSGKALQSTGGTTNQRVRQLFRSPRSSQGVQLGIHATGDKPKDVDYEQAPAYDFLTWSLRELPNYFKERDLTSKWKYLAEWLALIDRALLYHELPRPDSRQTDSFDLVTTDAEEKVLHLVGRVVTASKSNFGAFLERTIAAKQARIKTGDIGGAFFVARHFDDSVLEAYEKTLQESKSKGLLALEEAFTGYAGFVRIGARRGFHLLLVEETDDGYAPILPGQRR
jgi:hypothetical protein